MRGVYIHIPFCKTICSYCDFCKMYYQPKWIQKYLQALDKEINTYYQKDEITSIYIGGGTPTCLSITELTQLLNLTKLLKFKTIEFTCECNIDITEEQMKLLKTYGINRISIGIQTINDKHLKQLKRNHTKEEVSNKIKVLTKYFDNISVDVMYGLPNQTIEELQADLTYLTNLPIKHISTYSLMIEPHTQLYIDKVKPIDEDLDNDMYQCIKKCLKSKKFIHYETSNFCLEGYQSKHNLLYWNNQEYYGFGLSACGYIDSIRYENTKNFKNYINNDYRLTSHLVSKNEQLENGLILGLRKTTGIDKKTYESLPVVKKLIKEGKLKSNSENIYIDEEDQYIANTILMEVIGEIDEI